MYSFLSRTLRLSRGVINALAFRWQSSSKKLHLACRWQCNRHWSKIMVSYLFPDYSGVTLETHTNIFPFSMTPKLVLYQEKISLEIRKKYKRLQEALRWLSLSCRLRVAGKQLTWVAKVLILLSLACEIWDLYMYAYLCRTSLCHCILTPIKNGSSAVKYKGWKIFEEGKSKDSLIAL